MIDPRALGTFLARFDNSILQVVNQNGRVSYSSAGAAGLTALPVTPAQRRLAQSNTPVSSFNTVSLDGTSYRVLTQGGLQETNGVPIALQIGRAAH